MSTSSATSRWCGDAAAATRGGLRTRRGAHGLRRGASRYRRLRVAGLRAGAVRRALAAGALRAGGRAWPDRAVRALRRPAASPSRAVFVGAAPWRPPSVDPLRRRRLRPRGARVRGRAGYLAGRAGTGSRSGGGGAGCGSRPSGRVPAPTRPTPRAPASSRHWVGDHGCSSRFCFTFFQSRREAAAHVAVAVSRRSDRPAVRARSRSAGSSPGSCRSPWPGRRSPPARCAART